MNPNGPDNPGDYYAMAEELAKKVFEMKNAKVTPTPALVMLTMATTTMYSSLATAGYLRELAAKPRLVSF